MTLIPITWGSVDVGTIGVDQLLVCHFFVSGLGGGVRLPVLTQRGVSMLPFPATLSLQERTVEPIGEPHVRSPSS